MMIDYKDLSSVRKAVEVEVPAEAVTTTFDTVLSEFARQARIPGFRTGKVPRDVVRKRFHKDIEEEVTNRLLPRYFGDAVREKDVVPVGSPLLKRADALTEGSPLRFEAEFEIKPEFELKEYRGLEITPPGVEVEPKEIDATIEQLRERASTFRLAEDRAAEDGDYVVFDITTSVPGQEPRHNEGSHVRLGEETPLPELHDALRGHRPGEAVSFDKSYTEEATNESLRGKTVHSEITIREIRVRQLPEFDDTFARSLGFESAEDMRSKVETDLRAHKEHERLQSKRQQAAEQLTALYDFEVPETLVEEELGSALRNYARYLTSQGLDLDRVEMNWEKIGEDFRPEAIKRVRRSLVLEKIGRVEKLSVNDADVDGAIRRASSDARKELAEVKQRLRRDGGYESLRQSILQERALDFVVDQAKIVA